MFNLNKEAIIRGSELSVPEQKHKIQELFKARQGFEDLVLRNEKKGDPSHPGRLAPIIPQLIRQTLTYQGLARMFVDGIYWNVQSFSIFSRSLSEMKQLEELTLNQCVFPPKAVHYLTEELRNRQTPVKTLATSFLQKTIDPEYVEKDLWVLSRLITQRTVADRIRIVINAPLEEAAQKNFMRSGERMPSLGVTNTLLTLEFDGGKANVNGYPQVTRVRDLNKELNILMR